MFEKFFGQKTEENIESVLADIAEKIFIQYGVNSSSIISSFKILKEENDRKKYGFTDNRIINIVKNLAYAYASPIEDITMGGREQVYENIDSEIRRLYDRSMDGNL